MKKQMVMIALLCLGVHSSLWAIGKVDKTLFYRVNNHQDQEIILQCHVISLTGERIEGVTQSILPGQTEPLILCKINHHCKGSAVVKCKLRQKPEDYGIGYFWVSIPCERIENKHHLKLEVSKENKLSGYYP